MDATRTDFASFASFPWEGRAVGLMDLDAFFASVEQLDHPDWRGKPVIVGGSPEHRGVVSTASYEARRFGVHSAMPSWRARKLCPEAIWTHGHFDRYREVSAEVMAIIADETPLVEQVSIDEAFFDVTPGRYSRENPIDICRRIQRRVAELGVSCSIGIGANKTVAKIASERQKPHGLTVVLPGTEREFLAPLAVSAMSGIGKATEKRLYEHGIHTLGMLAQQDPERMSHLFGVSGSRMVLRAAGLEESPVQAIDAKDEVKSVSNERTFSKDLKTRDELEAAIAHVSALVGARLRAKGLTGSLVTLKLKFDLTHVHTAQRQLATPSDNEHEFGAVAIELLHSLWNEGTPTRLVGVAISHFGETPAQQMSLFEDVSEEDKETSSAPEKRDLRALSIATDDIRAKFGKGAVSYGRDLRFGDKGKDTPPMS